MAAARYISYLRVSTTKQGVSGLGLEAQRETVRQLLAGSAPLSEFVEVETGTNKAERPQLAAALARCRALRAVLVVANVSRLTRDPDFMAPIVASGVEVRFGDLPKIEGPAGKFMLRQMLAVAEFEAGLISERTRKALAAAKTRGVQLGGRRSNSATLYQLGVPVSVARRREAVSRRAADLAPLLAEIRADGAFSLRQIAAGLNAAGLTTAMGKPWGSVQVHRLLIELGERAVPVRPSAKASVQPVAPFRPSISVQPVAPLAAPALVPLAATGPAERTSPPRRNRVTPFGTFETTKARGTFLGNRGCLHDRDGVMGEKTFRHQNWLICALHFKGRRRTINSPGLYTELFFVDEATAMAAGHRPCAECQRSRYNAFKNAWRTAHGIASDARLSAAEIDAALHAGRVDRKGHQITHSARLSDLPDGVFVTLDGASERPLIWWRGLLHPWSHEGYGAPQLTPAGAMVSVLTPGPLVRTIAAGYAPEVRLAAEAQLYLRDQSEAAPAAFITISA